MQKNPLFEIFEFDLMFIFQFSFIVTANRKHSLFLSIVDISSLSFTFSGAYFSGPMTFEYFFLIKFVSLDLGHSLRLSRPAGSGCLVDSQLWAQKKNCII